MPRRKSLFEEVARAPWWMGVGMAFGSLILIELAVAIVAKPGSPFASLGTSLLPLRVGIPIAFLYCAGVSMFRTWSGGRLFKAQKCIADVHGLSWQQFEELVCEMYRRDGYRVRARGGASPDGGIDLVIVTDGRSKVVQCKHWKTRKVGVGPVRELFGVMHSEKADACVFVTSGEYTSEAVEFGRVNGIEMLDGQVLVRYLDTIRNGQQSKAPEAPVVKGVEVVVPNCPECGNQLVARTAGRGRYEGKRFWGCPRYPRCRGTRPV